MIKRLVLLLMVSLSTSGWCEVSRELESGKERVQCRAVTKSGNRCKRRAAVGKHYCHQHAADIQPKRPEMRCRSMTEDGKRCEEKPVEGKSYCEKHMY